jgi:hypothetical protein
LNPKFQIALRHSAGNLHVNLFGEFNGLCAWQLFKILKQHKGPGRIFVDTQAVQHVEGHGVELFRAHMSRRELPRDWLYFKGKKGFKIAPNGSRVLICNKGTVSTAKRNGQSKRKIGLAKKPSPAYSIMTNERSGQ